MKKKNKIYDCFLFFNELDLLEIRLNVLNDYVDYFVLVEATKTFSNKNKKLYYAENTERFSSFNHKIIHIVVDEHPEFKNKKDAVGDVWEYEVYQRNQIIKGLEKADDNDVVMISDVDEIPNPLFFLKVLNEKGIKDNPVQVLRVSGDKVYSKYTGWHFSFLGGEEKIKNKIDSFSHQQYNNDNVFNDISKNIEKGNDIFSRDIKMKVVDLNFQFPKYIVLNQDKYKHLIKDKK
jgi:beta-1,4-mannosyl-glycoprotein beta-1,4-N-acetylglucosaminyltransferase